ncbi:9043_t:CDS:2, partial [Ambispora leptoticha]
SKAHDLKRTPQKLCSKRHDKPVELPPTKKRKKPQKATLIIDEKGGESNTESMIIDAQKVMKVTLGGKIKGYVKGALEVLAPDFMDRMELDKEINNYRDKNINASKKQTTDEAELEMVTITKDNDNCDNHSSNNNRIVTIHGKGKAVTRTCSIVEIIKRIMKYQVHQYTLIGCEGTQDSLSSSSSNKEAGYQAPRIIDTNEVVIPL